MTERPGPAIDVHTHVIAADLPDFRERQAGPWPRLIRQGDTATIYTGDEVFRAVDSRLFSPDRRLEDMDRLGISQQVLSPPPVLFCYWASGEPALELAQRQNDGIAAFAGQHP